MQFQHCYPPSFYQGPAADNRTAYIPCGGFKQIAWHSHTLLHHLGHLGIIHSQRYIVGSGSLGKIIIESERHFKSIANRALLYKNAMVGKYL